MKKQWISLLTVLALLLTCTLSVWAEDTECGGGEACPAKVYADVDDDAWYHDSMDRMIEMGILKGVSETCMAPEGTLTRGMFVTMLYRLEGAPETEAAPVFKDVSADCWYADAVAWAGSNGVVDGYSAEIFAPEELVTREEIAAMLYRYAGLKYFDIKFTAELADFSDGEEVSDWALDAMQWAVAYGIFLGDDESRLLAGGDALRCQSAAVLDRFLETVYVEYDAIVSSTEGLEAALIEGGLIAVTEDVVLESVNTITEDTVITLQGDLDASAVASRPFEVADGVSLVIDAVDQTVTVGGYGLINVPADSEDVFVVLNGGTYLGNTDNGAFIKVRPGAGDVTILLNEVTYTDASHDGWILNTYGAEEEVAVSVLGGSLTAANGFQIKGDSVFLETAITVEDVAFEFVKGESLIGSSTITVNAETIHPEAPAAAVAASNNAQVTIQDSTIAGTMYAAYAVYSSGGTVIAENNDVSGASYKNEEGTPYWYVLDLNSYPEAEASIIIDGEEFAV